MEDARQPSARRKGMRAMRGLGTRSAGRQEARRASWAVVSRRLSVVAQPAEGQTGVRLCGRDMTTSFSINASEATSALSTNVGVRSGSCWRAGWQQNSCLF